MRTFLTRPSPSRNVSYTRATFQQFLGELSSITTTTSSTCRFLQVATHFCLGWRDCNLSFLHLVQNLLARCCTLSHLFFEYRSARWNSPGGDNITLDFMVSKWLGVRDSAICGEFIVSTVKGRQFTMASASIMKVLRVSSSSWAACCVRSDANTFQTARI